VSLPIAIDLLYPETIFERCEAVAVSIGALYPHRLHRYREVVASGCRFEEIGMLAVVAFNDHADTSLADIYLALSRGERPRRTDQTRPRGR
jgi:hypothetical protein